MSHHKDRELEKRKREDERILKNQIVLVSTFGVNCGISTYSQYLLDALNRISSPGIFTVQSINDGIPKDRIVGSLLHFQHEYGIFPKIPKTRGKVIITFHTVSNLKTMSKTIDEYEDRCNIVAYIVHSSCARGNIDSKKGLWSVPHGSVLIPQMKKEDARRVLGINEKGIGDIGHEKPIAFIFGLQSGDKKYEELIGAARKSNIHLIISGALHRLKSSKDAIDIENSENVTFLNKFLSEQEVNLYALASDLLLFDYDGKEHYSVSGAMHRIIGSGRPVICSDIRHFSDVEDNVDVLKFRHSGGLVGRIKMLLDNKEEYNRLSAGARNYAERTSWEKVAMQHIEIYKHYTNVI